MPEPTLQEILDDLKDAISALTELLRRELAGVSMTKLAVHDDTEGYSTTVWSPSKTNEDTAAADLDALTLGQLDTWLDENKTEVVRLLEPM